MRDAAHEAADATAHPAYFDLAGYNRILLEKLAPLVGQVTRSSQKPYALLDTEVTYDALTDAQEALAILRGEQDLTRQR